MVASARQRHVLIRWQANIRVLESGSLMGPDEKLIWCAIIIHFGVPSRGFRGK
jgi:hypothetical protein